MSILSSPSGSVTSISATDSAITTSSSFPTSTFPPRPSQSGNRGNGGQNPSGGANGFGNAASNLYLYTFLATLVLLLLVSGAVVARSITLRVRARRAIEESIRNGTYIPPPRGNGPNAPKPILHDAHIKDGDGAAVIDEKHGRWESFVPMAAAFVPSKSPRPLPHPATSAPTRPRSSLRPRFRDLNPFRSVQLQDILDELASRDLHSRMALQQAPAPTQTELASAAFRNLSSSTNDGNSGQQQGIDRPSAVRVAVLIAMPDPTRPTSSINVQDDASSSRSSAKGKTPASESDVAKSDDEAEMPYVEFGIAEVPFTSVSPRAPAPAVPDPSLLSTPTSRS